MDARRLLRGVDGYLVAVMLLALAACIYMWVQFPVDWNRSSPLVYQ